MAIDVLYGESGWVRVVPCNMDGSITTQINTLGTKVDFVNAVKATPVFIAPASATTETVYHTTAVANGNELVVVDNSKNYLAADGSEITDTGDTSMESVECSVMSEGANANALIDAYEDGKPIFVSFESGKVPSTGAPYEYIFLFGNITSLTTNPTAGPMTIDFTVTGKTFGAGMNYTIKETTPPTPDVGYAQYNTAATGGGKTITPLNDGSARTITAIGSGEWTTLGQGKIARK